MVESLISRFFPGKRTCQTSGLEALGIAAERPVGQPHREIGKIDREILLAIANPTSIENLQRRRSHRNSPPLSQEVKVCAA
jgi:hypothetical protein